MTPYPFPRPRDDKPYAWGLEGDAPQSVWERFSPAYEAQAERIARALEAAGYRVEFSGAGSEDGEYIIGVAGDDSSHALIHLEDPNEAQELAALDEAQSARFITRLASGES